MPAITNALIRIFSLGFAPEIRYNFTKIKDIENLAENTMVDVLAIVKEIMPKQPVSASKSSHQYVKQDIIIIDQSEHEIKLTLWGSDALNFNDEEPQGSVIAVKGAKVRKYKGCYELSGGSLSYEPPENESGHIRIWWAFGGESKSSMSLTHMARSGPIANYARSRPIPALTMETVSAQPDKVLSSFLKVTITSIDRVIGPYKGCRACCTKLEEQTMGWHLCRKCNKEVNDFKYCLVASLQITDSSGYLLADIFTENIKTLMKRDIGDLFEEAGRDSIALQEKLSDGLCGKSYTFRVRSSINTSDPEPRLKHTITDVNFLELSNNGLHSSDQSLVQ